MKISNQSWHYKLMKWVGITDPRDRTNLCSYIRGIFLTITIPLVLILSPIIIAIVLLLGLEPSGWIFAATIVTIFEVAILIVIGYTILSDYYSETIKHILFPNRIKRKEPNIFFEWLKAKKQKICPMIEFTNERSEE